MVNSAGDGTSQASSQPSHSLLWNFGGSRLYLSHWLTQWQEALVQPPEPPLGNLQMDGLDQWTGVSKTQQGAYVFLLAHCFTGNRSR